MIVDRDLKELFASSWTYHDVLALALAESRCARWTDDHGRWCGAIECLQATHHTLLGDIAFDRRRLPSLSSADIEGFIRTMTRSGAFEWTTGRAYIMTERARTSIQNGQRGRFAWCHAAIEDIARALCDRLGES